MDFFKKAFLEIKHVVWPTKKETVTYMNYNLIIIVTMTIFLSIIGFLFKEGLVQAKYLVNPNSRNTVQNFHEQQTQTQEQALQDTYEQFGLTGATITTDTEALSGANIEVNTDNTTVTTETAETPTEAINQETTENTETQATATGA